MAESGGIGLAQQVSMVLIEMQIAAAGFLVYNLPFLLLMPEFKCSLHGTDLLPGSQDHDAYCNQDYICNSGAVQGKKTE